MANSLAEYRIKRNAQRARFRKIARCDHLYEPIMNHPNVKVKVCRKCGDLFFDRSR